MVAVQLNEMVAVLEDLLVILMVAVLDEPSDICAPKIVMGFEPLAVTVIAPLDILLFVASDTATCTPVTGSYVPDAAYKLMPPSGIIMAYSSRAK